jgi:hypothetical protein
VIALLARRYGINVVLSDSNRYGGMCASVFLPEALLTSVPTAPEPAVPQPAGAGAPAAPPALTENGLPTRRRRPQAQQQQPSAAGRRMSTEPARPTVIGAWQQSNRRARDAAADIREDARGGAAHTEEERSNDS